MGHRRRCDKDAQGGTSTGAVHMWAVVGRPGDRVAERERGVRARAVCQPRAEPRGVQCAEREGQGSSAMAERTGRMRLGIAPWNHVAEFFF